MFVDFQMINLTDRCQNKVDMSKKFHENLENFITKPKEFTLESNYCCELCLKWFDSVETLKKHINEHCSMPMEYHKLSQEKTILTTKFVKIAPKLAISQSQLQANNLINSSTTEQTDISQITRKKKSINTKYKCHICKKNILNDNIIIHNQKCNLKTCTLACNKCDKIFANKIDLKYHKRKHLDVSPICQFCHKKFNNQQSYNIHIKRHTMGMRYNCDYCDKAYFTKSELQRHIQTHSVYKSHPCTLCDTTFPSQPELTRHLKYHNGTKQFQCNLCTKSFYESGHLKIHLRLHTGERPYVCELCSKAFVCNSKLVRHRKIHGMDKNTNIHENY